VLIVSRRLPIARLISLLASFAATDRAGAQTAPPIRPLGPIERVSTDSLASAATVVRLASGNVLVNDIRAHRVLMFDSTLAHAAIIADNTSATGNAYGRQGGTLIPYRGDSSLFIDPSSLSMLVVGPTGKIVRIMAIPRPDDAQRLIGNVFGTPGFDARGRMIYHGAAGMEGTFILCCVGTARVELRPDATPTSPAMKSGYDVPKPDSAFIVRVDLASRVVDTVATVKIPYEKQHVNVDPQGFVQSIETRRIPLPIIDGWVVTPDGSLAIVRGRDFHVDWLDSSGRWTSAAKMPFDWRRLTDEQKLALIDSSTKAEQAANEHDAALRASQLAAAGPGRAGGGGSRGGGGRGGGSGGGGGPGGAGIPLVAGRVDISDVPDYAPAFDKGAVYADTDNNLWIRTTTIVSGQPVYDIVNRRGELFDRVQLPPFRTIAGFGPHVVYMAVIDSAGLVHLERARVK
jgi:uncharacterized membrane protein YgcG